MKSSRQESGGSCHKGQSLPKNHSKSRGLDRELLGRLNVFGQPHSWTEPSRWTSVSGGEDEPPHLVGICGISEGSAPSSSQALRPSGERVSPRGPARSAGGPGSSGRSSFLLGWASPSSRALLAHIWLSSLMLNTHEHRVHMQVDWVGRQWGRRGWFCHWVQHPRFMRPYGQTINPDTCTMAGRLPLPPNLSGCKYSALPTISDEEGDDDAEGGLGRGRPGG